MIRIPSHPELETRIEQAAAKSFALKAKEITGYLGLGERAVVSGSRKLKASERLTFHFLQRQFEGDEVFVLRHLVSAGRLVRSTLRRLRGKA